LISGKNIRTKKTPERKRIAIDVGRFITSRTPPAKPLQNYTASGTLKADGQRHRNACPSAPLWCTAGKLAGSCGGVMRLVSSQKTLLVVP
jgi:hypothetical protein